MLCYSIESPSVASPSFCIVLFCFSFMFLPLLRMLVVFPLYLNSIDVLDDDYDGVDATGEDK